jgi:hypothetical protein
MNLRTIVAQLGGVPLVVEKRANAGLDTDAMRRQ